MKVGQPVAPSDSTPQEETSSGKTSTETRVEKNPEPSKENALLTTGNGKSSREEKAILHTHSTSGLSEDIADAPAVRVSLTVSSGFYVRSFAHDLGMLCKSYGTMSELARTRQADFTTMDPPSGNLVPALEYDDINKGEEVWGPKIAKVLEASLHSRHVS